MKYLFIGLIKLYQVTLSKILPPVCRFTPSCSAYSITAFGRFGVVKGGYLTVRRILRCHPFNEGGFDPVPGLSVPDLSSKELSSQKLQGEN